MNLDSLELGNYSIDELKLMGDYLLILPFARKEPHGFIIPENKKEKPTIGKVIKVGNGQLGDKKVDIIIDEGDCVIFNEWSAKSIEGLKYNNEISKLFYIKQSDVIGFFGGK
jgi:co-chaperonin GroES (HSP10)